MCRSQFGSGVRPARERACRRWSPFLFYKLSPLAPSSQFRHRPPCRSSGTATILIGGSASGVTTRAIGGSRRRWSGLHCVPGDGGFPSSIDAGLLREFHRRRSSFREGEAQSDLSSPAFGHGEWRLLKFRAAVLKPEVLWVVVSSLRCEKYGLLLVAVLGSPGLWWFIVGGDLVSSMDLSGEKTERSRVVMVTPVALQVLSAGETRLSVVSSGGCAKGAGDAWHADGLDSYTCAIPSLLVATRGQAVRVKCLGFWAVYFSWASAVIAVALFLFV
ncbi:LOW QUALITY PROTEIN: hypothetical protein HID58_010357 [Brassica napus]|uniref:Uncharacterized protein n=1 Tax=Brassica napus TaxID=3708 RepID=A0ABQ8DV23_BRANA|nr:LOW QUALITY PROTEIN: hypothetical protein HID58_010357 [Brassica napus]